MEPLSPSPPARDFPASELRSAFPAIYCDAISILDNNGQLTRTAIAVLSIDIMGQLLAKYP